MKKTLWIALGLLVVAAPATGQSTTIVGSQHDLSSVSGPNDTWSAGNVDQICVFCHTSHQAPEAGAQDPLWNHQMSSETAYGVYASDTLEATDIRDIADTSGSNFDAAATSRLCMSCHDGTVALGALFNNPNNTSDGGDPDNDDVYLAAFPANIDVEVGTNEGGLRDDHPINFTYPEMQEGLETRADVDSLGLLFDDTVQCSSCHVSHDNDNPPFLRLSNTGSELCLTCHDRDNIDVDLP